MWCLCSLLNSKLYRHVRANLTFVNTLMAQMYPMCDMAYWHIEIEQSQFFVMFQIFGSGGITQENKC